MKVGMKRRTTSTNRRVNNNNNNNNDNNISRSNSKYNGCREKRSNNTSSFSSLPNASRHRYAATVEKGDNAWKEQWGGFISGVNLKRMGDGYGGVALKASSDLQRAIEQHYARQREFAKRDRYEKRQEQQSEESEEDLHHVEKESVDEAEEQMPALTFAYLFSSPAERKAAREAQRKEEELRKRKELEERRQKRFAELEQRRAKKLSMEIYKATKIEANDHSNVNNNSTKEMESDDDDDDDDDETLLSKHQRALLEAQRRGLKLENMSRKEKREFLHLTVSKEQQEAQERAKEFKLHELMDPKMAWYQQGPHPIDLIAEKLVTRKAEKKGKQMGLKYNYYLPHPSWIAKRAQHRKESVLVGLGRRLVFDNDGNAIDPLRNVRVNPTQVNLLLNDAKLPACADLQEVFTNADVVTHHNNNNCSDSNNIKNDKSNAHISVTDFGEENNNNNNNINSDVAYQTIELGNVIVDPIRAQRSYVKAVVQNREAALAIKKANLSTNYLSNNLIQGPSLANDKEEEE